MQPPKHLVVTLCYRCTHHREIRSGKGSVFLLCELGLGNNAWPKYPPQPVLRCPHFQENTLEETDSDKGAEST